MMEGDEIEMSKEELQQWIREKVEKNKLVSSEVLGKCNLLQSLLERREKRAAHLQRLCRSVSACEAIVKEQYSLLGWKYRDTDSDDDEDNKTGCANAVPRSPTTNGTTPLSPKLRDSENLHRDNGEKSSNRLKREPVVVLTRLSARQISSLCSPKPENHSSEDESLSDLDSDTLWEPEVKRGSQFSFSSSKTLPQKRRKIDEKDKKRTNSPATVQASTNAEAKSDATETSTPEASANTDAVSSGMKGVRPVCKVTALCQTSNNIRTTPCTGVQPGDLNVKMIIFARRKAMTWQQGILLEIVKKEDGKLKYKIQFKENGKILVSGHHVAFAYRPREEQLFVGARVVVQCPTDKSLFSPGILGELPGKSNKMRFLVFIDDHKPIYVSIDLLRLVSRPLEDPLDDIPDGFHKNFMRDYMKAWPNPPKTQYTVGQKINAELKGVLRRCEVQEVDCSLIQVLVLTDKRKKWIYRGSTCLEHMTNVKKPLRVKRGRGAEEQMSPS